MEEQQQMQGASDGQVSSASQHIPSPQEAIPQVDESTATGEQKDGQVIEQQSESESQALPEGLPGGGFVPEAETSDSAILSS